MPGFVVTAATQIACLHQGIVKITPHQVRVLAAGSSVVTTADVTVVAGCALSAATPPSPCVQLDFALAGSARVFVDGQPVITEPLGPGAGLCVSANQARQGTPLIQAVQQAAVGS